MPKLNKKIGLIGAGNMGEAFVGALIRSNISDPSKIYISDISKERRNIVSKTFGVSTTNDNFKLFSECSVVMLAVKPQQIDQLLSQVAGQKGYKIPERKLVISIAAGIAICGAACIIWAREFKRNWPLRSSAFLLAAVGPASTSTT